jgi:hypothetical protein
LGAFCAVRHASFTPDTPSAGMPSPLETSQDFALGNESGEPTRESSIEQSRARSRRTAHMNLFLCSENPQSITCYDSFKLANLWA